MQRRQRGGEPIPMSRPAAHRADPRWRSVAPVTLCALAYVFAMFVASGARAQSSAADAALLVSELGWLQRAGPRPAHMAWRGEASLLPFTSWGVAARLARSPEAPIPGALERQRGRYRTLKVAGYLVAAATATLSVVAIPLLRGRSEHVNFYGDESCGRNLFPSFAAPAFAGGLAVGITGSVRDRKLERERGSGATLRTPWRAALAGAGVALTIAALTSVLIASALCNS